MPGDTVEPVQLQVVCTELWRALPPGTTVITSEHVNSLGDATAALAHYYDNAVRGTAKQVRLDSILVRRWISAELITAANTRGTAYRGVLLTAGLPNPAVDELENRHLIRAETRAGARWYELTHDRFLRPIEQANVKAKRQSRLGYLGVLLPVAVLVIGVWVRHPWPHGLQDVLSRVALALIATAGIVHVSWTFVRRRLQYWRPCERRLRRTRLASLARNTPPLLIVASAWLSILLIVPNMWTNSDRTPGCGGQGAMAVLYRHAGFSGTCLHESSMTVNWGLVISSIVLAAVMTFGGSRLTRRLAVRKWRRMAVRRTGETARGEPARTAPPERAAPPELAGGVSQPPRNGPVPTTPG